MNQIILRTHKGEYLPGDYIYGVIYVNIVSPTTGTGLGLKLLGFETVHYKSDAEAANTEYNVNRNGIEYRDVELCNSTESFLLGSYVFPFRFRLQTGIPGSFIGEGQSDDCVWNAGIHYCLSAYLKGAETIQTVESLVVLCPLPVGVTEEDTLPGVNERLELPIMLLPFMKRKLFVTAKLLSNTQLSGDVLKLRIIITNETRRNVTSIIVRLVREIILMVRGNTGAAKEKDSVQGIQDRVFISPEEGPLVVWESEVKNCDPVLLNRGLDNFCIPLKDAQDKPIPPCVQSTHIQCRYLVEILVKLDNNRCLSASLPVPCIRHSRNVQWVRQEIPPWVNNAEVKSIDSPYSVPNNTLGSEVFSGIPRFQALNS